VGDFDDLGGCFPGICVRPISGEFHAAILSSLSAPRMTILSKPSGSGRCSVLASSHGARIQTSRSSTTILRACAKNSQGARDAPLRPRRGQKPLPKNGLFSCEPPAPGRFLRQNLVGSPDYEPTSLLCRPSPLRHFLNLKCGSSFPRAGAVSFAVWRAPAISSYPPQVAAGSTLRHHRLRLSFRGCSFQPKYVPRTRGLVCRGVRASCLLVRGPFHLA
jgi:hypothetical protein